MRKVEIDRLPALLNCGFNNYIATSQLVALVDIRTAAARRIVKSAVAEKPRNIIDICRGRRAMTLIILTGDRYVKSPIPRKQLARRLGFFGSSEEEEPAPKVRSRRANARQRKNTEPAEETFQPEPGD